jgi:AraC family ethanolamine operon transcriptional activator
MQPPANSSCPDDDDAPSPVAVFEAHDVEEAVELLYRWDGIDRRYVQVDRGRFSNGFTVLELGDVTLLRSTADPGYVLTGASAAGWQAMFLLTPGSTPTRWYGRDLVPGALGLCLANEEHSGRSFGPVEFLNVSLSIDALRAHGRSLGRDDLEAGLTGSPWREPDRTPRGLESELRRILESVSSLPGPLREPARRELAVHLLDVVVDAVTRPAPSARIPTPVSRRHAIARTRELLTARARHVPTLPELCGAIGMSQRTIEYAFRDQFGLRPVQFLKLVRLNRARSVLACSADSTSVTDVAMDFGFWDLGHFARDYRELFGETPSQTLRRASR